MPRSSLAPQRLTVLTFLIFSAFLFAQERDKPFVSKRDQDVKVTVRLVDFTAVDGRGRFVTDLRQEEIQLRVEGELVPVASLESYSALPTTMSALADNALDRETARQQPRLIVLFFDRSYSSQSGIMRARDAAVDFVTRNLSPQDRVMVMSYDRTVNVDSFTTDRARTLAAIGKIRIGFEGFALEPPKNWAFSAKNKTTQEERYDAHLYIRKLNEIAAFLKPFRGRKSLILLSQGNPLLGNLALGGLSENSNMVSEFRLDETAHLFSDANTLIYSVDIAGVRTDALDRGGTQQFNGSQMETVNEADPYGFEEGSQTSLFFLANETGGRIFRNNNDISALMDLVADEIGNYYVLGFSSSDRVNGDFRSLSISTTRPGVTIRAGRGFLPPRSIDRMSSTERLLNLEEVFNRDRPIDEIPDAAISLLSFPREDGAEAVTVVLDLPLAQGDGTSIELLAYLYSGAGAREDGFFKQIDLPAPGADSRFRHQETLVLPDDARKTLKVVVRDDLSGKRVSRYFQIAGDNPEREWRMRASSLFLLDPQPERGMTADRELVHDREEEVGLTPHRAAYLLSGVRGDGIVPCPLNRANRADAVRIGLFVRGLDFTRKDDMVGYQLAVYDASHTAYEVPIRSLTAVPVPGGGSDVLIFTLDMSGVPAGDSTLMIRLGSRNAGEGVERTLELELR